MIVLDCVQGTTDWLIERLWRLTASEAKSNITSTGLLSKSEAAMAAIDRLIAGLDLAGVMLSRRGEIDQLDDKKLKLFMAHYTGEKFSGNAHTERGNDYEADALALLAEKINMPLHDIGMCVMGRDARTGVVSCSPDGVGYNSQNILTVGAEVKNPCLANFHGIIADGGLPAQYKLQVHFSMAVCELNSWHFAAHFTGKPIYHYEVKRDHFTDTVAKSLVEFGDVYRERYLTVTDALAKMSSKKIKPKRELEGLI